MSELKQFDRLTPADIADIFERCRRVMIIAHRAPDGDAIGSSFALKIILEALGITAVCVCPDECPERLRFLMYGQDSVVYRAGMEEDLDLICTVDVASPNMLASLAPLIDHIALMIDHHSTGDVFAPGYIDPDASACGEIIFGLYEIFRKRGRIIVLPEAARRMFAAISSDTGSFRYSNTTPATFIAASVLCGEINESDGMDTAEIARRLHDSQSMTDIRVERVASDNLHFYRNDTVCIVSLDAELINSENLPQESLSSIVDLPRSIEGVVVAASLKQENEDRSRFKVSMRSNCNIDVAEICVRFGGGGHVRAAGCTACADSPEAALKLISDVLCEAADSYDAGGDK